MSENNLSKRIYLDHAAATPVRPEVLETMLPYLTENFGNASSIHQEGVRARKAVNEARSLVARTLEVKPEGVIFTGNGTESNNLAIMGHLKHLHKDKGVAYEDMEVVTTRIEHPSIMEILPALEALGVVVRLVEVDEGGLITVPALTEALSPKTVLVAMSYANSEIGAVQPVSRLVRTIRKYEKTEGCSVVVHLDAAQAPLWLPCALGRLGVDMMALDAGKCNGPKGVGVLVMRQNMGMRPIMYGGGQEDSLRPGTENVAGIVGMAKALELAQSGHQERAEKVTKLRDEAIALLQEKNQGAVINGAIGESRLANNINFSLPGFDTEYAVVYLDTHGVAASTKSACAGAGGGESVVVKTTTGDATRARTTIRFSLGEDTTKADLEYAINTLANFCEKMKG